MRTVWSSPYGSASRMTSSRGAPARIFLKADGSSGRRVRARLLFKVGPLRRGGGGCLRPLWVLFLERKQFEPLFSASPGPPPPTPGTPDPPPCVDPGQLPGFEKEAWSGRGGGIGALGNFTLRPLNEAILRLQLPLLSSDDPLFKFCGGTPKGRVSFAKGEN